MRYYILFVLCAMAMRVAALTSFESETRGDGGDSPLSVRDGGDSPLSVRDGGYGLLSVREWGEWRQWGDLGDGRFANPIIPADYSDIDCIRVGEKYYAISSTFQFSPGMTLIESRDLVNWRFVTNIVDDLTQISPELGWQRMNRYGRGIWAGTLRHHAGRFYLFFGTPDEGFFMTSSQTAEGPWEPLTCLLAEKGWDDCSAMWTDDGQAWFIGTCFADGYKSYLFPMSTDGRKIDRDKAVLVNEGSGREASKLISHEGLFYIVFSEARGGARYVLAKRAKNIAGPYDEERQLTQPNKREHEPNQGGIVEGPDGCWYFLTHHGMSGDWSGRVVSLLPVEWRDGWPMIGQTDGTEPGVMVWEGKMPMQKADSKNRLQTVESKSGIKSSLGTSDDFDSLVLSPQWQWNYQPRESHYSLTERPGWLRLKAFKPLETDQLMKAGNTLTARVFRTANSRVEIKLDLTNMTDGQRCGLCHFASKSSALGVAQENGVRYIEPRNLENVYKVYKVDKVENFENLENIEKNDVTNLRYLWLRSEWGLDGRSTYSYSLDGKTFIPVGEYQLQWGSYRGDRYGIYCFNNAEESGSVDIDYCHYEMEDQPLSAIAAKKSPEAQALYQLLQKLHADGKMLSGQMWAPWGIDEVERIHEITGHYPAVRGHDLIHEASNAREVELMTEWHRRGGIVTLMWHWGAPTKGEGYEQSKMTIDVARCLEEGTAENVAMWQDLRRIAVWLKRLKDNRVPVLWRPMHEFDGKWFWYGKGGGQNFVRLWQTVYNYLAVDCQLDNLVWVLPISGEIDETYRVAPEYFDIVGPDTYDARSQGRLFNKVREMYGPDVLIPLHECGTLPDPDLCLADGTLWSWFMLWHTDFVTRHNPDELRRIYNHPAVVTLEDLAATSLAADGGGFMTRLSPL